MGNAEIGPDLGDHRLRRNAASPEHRQLVDLYRNRIAIIGFGQIPDADRRRQTDMDRRAVHRREA